MKKKLLVTMLTLTVAVALLAGGTMAWFTDTDDAGTATFTAGILDVDVSDGLGEVAEFNIGPIDHMNPGDVYKPIIINITNKGNKKLAWFGDWTFDVPNTEKDVILDAMYIDSMKMEFLKPDGNGNWEETDEFIKDGKGYGTYAAAFDALIDDEWGVITLRKWNDNNTMGISPFEHMGALMPGYSYRLTVQFGFNSKADNKYQGRTVTIGFNVKATQVQKDALDDEIGAGKSTHYDWFIDQLKKQGYQQE